ncbi:hypothetical protein L1987_60172 [Smallanthus sonchifolius]|uniref:Uncharacterized protein n=1 Tax=Smallanthus sonchifolius TaxID=185202 RepID=A0ACB9D7W7_9ASTR|nr:hypothetical protein L1987_60172 [Smallanthus sonchifolius]
MSGRGHGGRGNINMTTVELTALINERVAEAVAASQATHNVAGTLEGPALTWWNSQVQILGLDIANTLPWEEFKTMLREEYCPRHEIQKLEVEFWNLKMEVFEIELYTTRSHEYAVMCPHMVTPTYKRIKRYIDGLVPQIQSMVTSSNPTTIQQTIRGCNLRYLTPEGHNFQSY